MRCVIAFVVICGFAASAAGEPASAETEINALLAYVASLQTATFIRNGTAHTSAEAVQHLRAKWQTAGTRVDSAESFIDHCASGSWLTGQPYLIRFADGHTEESAVVLHRKLAKLRAKR